MRREVRRASACFSCELEERNVLAVSSRCSQKCQHTRPHPHVYADFILNLLKVVGAGEGRGREGQGGRGERRQLSSEPDLTNCFTK